MKKLRLATGLAVAASAATMLVSTPAFASTSSVTRPASVSAPAAASSISHEAKPGPWCGWDWRPFCHYGWDGWYQPWGRGGWYHRWDRGGWRWHRYW